MGSTGYAYDLNGNMITRGSQSLTWDIENRPTSIGASTFVYDGDGNRVKKVEGGSTTVYANRYYEKNLTTSEVTLYYYLSAGSRQAHGDKMVAMKKGATLSYVHQDHLTGTAVVSDNAGAQVGTTIKFFPFGATRSGTVPTDKKFTGQRLDATGLYYYGARYYDADIGRFISADSIVPGMANPQAQNRYSYTINNPLRYTDPTGHGPETGFTEEAGGTVRGGGGSIPPASAPVVAPTAPPAATSPATPVAGSGEGETGGGGGGSVGGSSGPSGPSTSAPRAALPGDVTVGVSAGVADPEDPDGTNLGQAVAGALIIIVVDGTAVFVTLAGLSGGPALIVALAFDEFVALPLTAIGVEIIADATGDYDMKAEWQKGEKFCAKG